MSRRLNRSYFGLMAGLVAACVSPVETTTPPPALTGSGPFVVSNPVASGSGAGGQNVTGSSGAGPVVYVSLPPGAVPGGTRVSIRVERTGAVASAALYQGGLDPVAVPAVAGDTISLIVERTGATASVWRFEVSAIRKPPVIVRTRPEKNKRDVPLNASIVVVFSEPIDPASLTPQNFELRSGGSTVAGQLAFTNGGRTFVEFTPAADLEGSREYELVLRTGIRDSDGTPFEAVESISFSTAPPPPAVLGQLVVTAATSGVELAPAGYEISVDGGAVQSLGVNGTVTFGSLLPGSHRVTLGGLGASCSVRGTNPRLVSIGSGARVTVTISVTCLATAVSQLAFVRDNQIHLVNSDGTGLVQLTNTGAGVANLDPAWSPDGRRLAFTRDGGGSRDIYVMDADGSNLVQLTSGGVNWEPAWAPDGREIAFSSFSDGSAGIFVVGADGGQRSRVLLNYPGYDGHPAWSPDGRKLTFTSDWRAYDFVYDLYVMNADGSLVYPLLEGPFFGNDNRFYFQSAWSPDGQQIAVVVCGYGWRICSSNAPDAPRGFPQSYSDIAVANADGSGLRVIAHTDGYARPTWSPDGRTIAFASANCSGSLPCLRFVRVDGSAEGLLISNGYSPAWRP